MSRPATLEPGFIRVRITTRQAEALKRMTDATGLGVSELTRRALDQFILNPVGTMTPAPDFIPEIKSGREKAAPAAVSEQEPRLAEGRAAELLASPFAVPLPEPHPPTRPRSHHRKNEHERPKVHVPDPSKMFPDDLQPNDFTKPTLLDIRNDDGTPYVPEEHPLWAKRDKGPELRDARREPGDPLEELYDKLGD